MGFVCWSSWTTSFTYCVGRAYVYLGRFYRDLFVCADGVGTGGAIVAGADFRGDDFVFLGIVFGVANKVAPLLAAARTRNNLVRREQPFCVGFSFDNIFSGDGEFGGGAGAGDGI